MSEITRLLTQELEALRAEDRRREELLTGLVQQLTTRLESLTKRQEQLNAGLDRLQTDLQRFDSQWSELAESLKKP